MELNELKMSVYRANLELKESGLVLSTFGNVSGVDRERAVLVIKPSGVPYDTLSQDNMVCVSLETGEVMDSGLNPSSDTPTHLELYRAFTTCGGIVHSHSEYATACAQSRIPIRCMGTTHADYFFGDIPVTREMSGPRHQKTTKKIPALLLQRPLMISTRKKFRLCSSPITGPLSGDPIPGMPFIMPSLLNFWPNWRFMPEG